MKKLMTLIFAMIAFSIFGNAIAGDDNRTPLQKYQGAYIEAYLTCAMKQKIIYLREKTEEKGEALSNDLDMVSCKKDGLARMKKEYLRVLPLVKGNEGRDSLKEHYVHAVMHIKEISPLANEDEATYMERMNNTFRKSRELYVRFEITQP